MTKRTSNQFINIVCYKTDMNSLKKVRKQNQALQKQFEKVSLNHIKAINKKGTLEGKLSKDKEKAINKENKMIASAYAMNAKYDKKIANDKSRYDNMKESRINNYILSLKGVTAAEKVSIRNQLRQIKNLDKMNRRMKQLKIQAGKVKIGGKAGLSKGGKAIPMKGAGAVGMAAGVVGSGITALGAGTLSLVASNGDQYRELANQAKQAEMTVKQYQIVSAGARKEGITQEKLGDQLKDVGEKWGEYFKIVDGGYNAKGTGTEAVEILQEAGYSLTEISKMKPDIVMKKLAKAFTSLNIGEARRKLVMEDLADESSRTIKAYITGFDGVNKQLEKYNWLISDSDITKYIEAASQVDTMGLGFKKLQSEFVLAFVGDEGLQTLTDNWLTTLKNIEQPVKEMGNKVRKEFDSIGQAMETLTSPDLSAWDKIKEISKLLKIDFTAPNGGFTLDFANSDVGKGLQHIIDSFKPNAVANLSPHTPFNNQPSFSQMGKPYQISTATTHTQRIKNEVKVKVELNTDLFTASVDEIANNALQDSYSTVASNMTPDS